MGVLLPRALRLFPEAVSASSPSFLIFSIEIFHGPLALGSKFTHICVVCLFFYFPMFDFRIVAPTCFFRQCLVFSFLFCQLFFMWCLFQGGLLLPRGADFLSLFF